MKSEFCHNVHRIQINADLGEGTGQDNALMPYLDLCSIACGGHYGDHDTIAAAIDLALKHQVNIGAHPSYPDPENFGRISMPIDEDELTETIREQLYTFKHILDQRGGILHHIKFHGALYNDMIQDQKLFTHCLRSAQSVCSDFKLITAQPQFSFANFTSDYPILWEVFGDRHYDIHRTLLPRAAKNALISDPKTIVSRTKFLLEEGKIYPLDGVPFSINYDTICIHSDTPNATRILKAIRRQLNQWKKECQHES